MFLDPHFSLTLEVTCGFYKIIPNLRPCFVENQFTIFFLNFRHDFICGKSNSGLGQN